jgi:hypothetical protein
VHEVLERWKLLGIVTTVGTHPYSFRPGKAQMKQIRFFLKHWKQNSWRTKVLGMLLAKEG